MTELATASQSSQPDIAVASPQIAQSSPISEETASERSNTVGWTLAKDPAEVKSALMSGQEDYLRRSISAHWNAESTEKFKQAVAEKSAATQRPLTTDEMNGLILGLHR